MRESISYTFLLNIVIVFISVCAAIILGVFSYYRAFRANTIIVSEIEKYEGYNCLSKASIASKLESIGYKVPFASDCKSDDSNCSRSTDGYAIVSYNLDYSNNATKAFSDNMNANYSSDGSYTRLYQYGVYTYMYVDIPVVNGLFKLSYYSRTSPLYEFRKMGYLKYSVPAIEDSPSYDYDGLYNLDFIPADIVFKVNYENPSLSQDELNSLYIIELANRLFEDEDAHRAKRTLPYYYDLNDFGYGRSIVSAFDLKDAYLYSFYGNSQSILMDGRLVCGQTIDWSLY